MCVIYRHTKGLGMKKELKTIAFIIMSMASLGFGMKNFAPSEQVKTQQKKSSVSVPVYEDPRELEADIQKHAYKLFHEKIIGGYLYDNKLSENQKAKRNKKLIPENYRVGDKNYKSVINYSLFSSKTGDADAELFWNLVKDATFYYTTHRQSPLNLKKVDSDRYHVTVDTMRLRYINEDMDTVATTLIFGNRYIDLNNEYVAKHINEIRQVCYLARFVESTKQKMREEAARAKIQELENKRDETIKDINTLVR